MLIMLKIIPPILFALFFLSTVFAQVEVNTDNIDIVRDEYGVPHIFTQTDLEAVYGIAWAQCEDNFNLMQENFAPCKNLSGRLAGKNGVVLDYIYTAFEIEAFIDQYYARDISPRMDSLLQAYTTAINRYATTHPKEVRHQKLFPVRPKEALATYILNFLVSDNSVRDLGKILTKEYEYESLQNTGRGSNAMAYSPNKTVDGNTYLVGNPHQPVNHFANFWEVSVHSEEGYEFFGVTLSGGGLTPVIGTNRHLGWTHTTNYQNCNDIYQLNMHPTKKGWYQYDGEWKQLEKKKAKLRVKIGPVVIPVAKTYYTSVYGPTFKKKAGFYAIKSNALINLKAVEQWYKMGLAQNFEEFMEALNVQGLPSQTITYADKDGNISHISNTNHPIRNENYNWTSVLPGDTSATNWATDVLHPIQAIPQVSNPNCGYVYNCNNTVFKMTAPAENLKVEDYPKSFGLLTSNTVRANTFEQQITWYDKVSFEDVRAIRENTHIDLNLMSFRYCTNCADIPQIIAKYPELKAVKVVFDKWNGAFEADNKQASLMALMVVYITEYIVEQFGNLEKDVPEKEMVKALLKAEKFLNKHYGTLEVALGTVQKAVRYDVEMPMYGSPNTLANGHFKPYKKGKLKLVQGDTYLFYAKYEENGLTELHNINVFGNSNKKGHPHSTDQLKLYVDKKTKQVELDKVKLRGVNEAYHPK